MRDFLIPNMLHYRIFKLFSKIRNLEKYIYDICIQRTWTGSCVSLHVFMQAASLLAQGMASGHTFSVNPVMFH